jgi:hypothetical protein
MAQLLMGPILLDTVNFASDSARFNEKDTRAFEALKKISTTADSASVPSQSPQALFDKLQAEKFSVASLSSRDLLRKDYKEFHLKIAGTLQAQLGSPQRRAVGDDAGDDVLTFRRARPCCAGIAIGGQRSVKLGISSVGQSVQAWADHEANIPLALAKWFREQGLDLLLANTAFFDQEKGI